jgi:hypothetical protein
MRSKLLLRTVAALAVSTASAVSAQAVGIAGWDFSQYFSSGELSIDGATYTDTLSANYSNLDPSFNAGAESAAYGTLFLPSAGTGNDPFVPFTGSLASNLAFSAGSNPFDSHTILLNEGQVFQNFLSMTATTSVSVVFQGTVASLPGQQVENWALVLGGRTLSGSQSVGVEFSTDGVSYTSVGGINLTSVDTPFTVNFGATPSQQAFVRLSFSAPGAGGLNQAIIDNVTLRGDVVPIPEPGTAAMLLVGLVGLARAGRRHA